MSINDNTPPHWNRFVELVKQNAPRSPMAVQSQSQINRANAGRTAGVIQTLLDGMNVSVPGPVGHVVNATTANSAGDFANATADGLISQGAAAVTVAEAGPLVGGLLMLMRNTYQTLDRSDQMVRYLLGTTGFVTTLARACVGSMRENLRSTRMPMPVIPRHIRATGDLFAEWREQAYRDGYERVRRTVARIDEVRPANFAQDYYSKRCLLHIAIQTGFTGQHSEDNVRLRRACEDIILREFLATDMRRTANNLRRWASAA